MGFGWLSILRLGLVQTALGAVVVLCTATINRVMIVELSLLAMIPAALVGIYHAFQLLRPTWGHRADQGRRRTPWVLAGMGVLALGTVGAALATAWMETAFWPGLALGAVSFGLVGLGLGASATSLLAMLASNVAPERKTAAGSLVWIMMIAGLAISGITIGQVLDPYSGERLVIVSLCVGLCAIAVTGLALWGLEAPRSAAGQGSRSAASFRAALLEVLTDPAARGFTVFVFVAMLAYNTQDLILEPFGGHVFGMTPGQSTALGGTMHAGALAGMLLVFGAGLAGSLGAPRLFTTRGLIVLGCTGSCLALMGLAYGAGQGETWPLTANVMALGFSNGVFAVAAIGMMMTLSSDGRQAREGTRMGVFGAAQSLGFALGAGLGALALDLLRTVTPHVADAYAAVFAFEGALFLVSAMLATRFAAERPRETLDTPLPIAGE